MRHAAAVSQLSPALLQPGPAEKNAAAWTGVLADIPLFTGLRRGHLRKLAGIARVERFESGTAITSVGQPGDAFFVLLDGSVRVARPGLPSLTLELGSFFGEMSLLDGGPRTATITAKGEVTCLTISRPRFVKLLRSEPALAVAMVEELARRLRSAQAVS